MAYVATDPTQQQNQNQQPGAGGQTPTNQAAPMTSAGTGAGPTGGKGAPTGAASNQQAAQPFTNLQSYLSANAPQIQDQANTISNNLTNQYGQVQNDVNAGTTAFNNQVSGGYAAPNAQVVQQAAANPTQFVQDPNNVAAFQSQINDQYTGPANFEGTAGYTGLNNEVNTAAQNASQVNTLPGLQTYLQGTETNPTQGENTLDSVLLNQSPAAIQQVQQAAAPFAQLPGYLSGNVTSADANAANAQTQAQQASQAAQDAFTGTGGVVPTWETALQNNFTNDQNEVNQANAQIAAGNSAATPLEQAYQTYLAQGGYGFSNPIESLINQAPVAMPTQAQAASSSDYAEQAALQQLLGSEFTGPLNSANASQAGQFQTPQVQTSNPQSLSQKLADEATQATWDKQEVPSLQAILAAAGNSNPSVTDRVNADLSDSNAGNPALSQIINNPSIPFYSGLPQAFNPKAYEALLQYLQGNDPGIISQGNGYYVNS